MSKVIFSEKQTFRQVTWIWMIIIPISVGVCAVMLYGCYQQFVLNIPWGERPASDTGLIVLTLATILILAATLWLMLAFEVSFEINDSEFRYRFFPYATRWKVLTPDSITRYSVGQYNIWGSYGLGYHKSLRSKTVRMIVKPDFVLTLSLTDGGTIVMSTTNKEETERAMRKLMSNRENT